AHGAEPWPDRGDFRDSFWPRRTGAGGGVRALGIVRRVAFGRGLPAIRGVKAGRDAAAFGAQQGLDLRGCRHGGGGHDQRGGHAGRHGAGNPGGRRPDPCGKRGHDRLGLGPEGSVMDGLRDSGLWRHPLFWILAAAAGLRLAGLFWGLPASDGWDDDGFAPRNFLTALALTYKTGSYFTYPPLHAFLLALLTAPGIVAALLHAPSFHQADVITEFTKPGYMTFFAVVGRLVSLVMSLGIIWSIGE